MLSSTDQQTPVQPSPTTRDVWNRRLVYLRIILITVILAGILFWFASQIIVVLLIFLVAALLAYAIVPVIDLLHRFMPRFLAMAFVYLVAIVVFGFLAYITIKTLIPQLNSFAQSVQKAVTPGSNGQPSPLDQSLQSLGFTQSQINATAKQIQSQLSSSAPAITKGIEQAIGSLISAGFNILITVVVSVYLLVDGYRFGNWLIGSSPLSQRGWVSSVLEILQRVVGGYIRGQIIMSTCMGVMQFIGMSILGVPYAPLIGALAFFLEFIPDIGTIVTGFVAVVIALTVSWQLALVTLIYTIIVDCIEGYVLSPRIIGRAVEIKPVVSLLAMIAGSELFGIWGAILAAPTIGLIQALVGAYWQYYQKMHAEEFPLQHLEEKANPQEEPAQPVAVEPAINEQTTGKKQ
ncbi:MAG TPA: AI-2E family transporter [Ktedonobacteraceae bacterium]|nr:AI-2E family transporter [Ktedonobacteraceae bacterium]